jgi:hypothetical protein
MSERLSFSSTKYGPSVCWGLTTQIEVAVVVVRAGIWIDVPVVSTEADCPRKHPISDTAAVPPKKPSTSRRFSMETTEILFIQSFFMAFAINSIIEERTRTHFQVVSHR